MNLLREYIRATLKESRFKQMSKAKFTGLQSYLANSSFLDADPEGDLDDDDDWASEAANVLRDDLNNYFDDNFGNGYLSAIVKTDMMATSSAAKDDVLKGASYYFDNGLHILEVILANIEDGTTIKNVEGASDKVYEVLLHELLHMQQFLKFSRGEPTDELWDKFMEEYKKRGGSSGMGADYPFFDQDDGASELETFSLQVATELVNSMGKEKAVSLLQQQNPDYETIRNNSRSFRDIEAKGNSPESRAEFRELVKRAKQYAKNT